MSQPFELTLAYAESQPPGRSTLKVRSGLEDKLCNLNRQGWKIVHDICEATSTLWRLPDHCIFISVEVTWPPILPWAPEDAPERDEFKQPNHDWAPGKPVTECRRFTITAVDWQTKITFTGTVFSPNLVQARELVRGFRIAVVMQAKAMGSDLILKHKIHNVTISDPLDYFRARPQEPLLFLREVSGSFPDQIHLRPLQCVVHFSSITDSG
jgi:hypothetical protein